MKKKLSALLLTACMVLTLSAGALELPDTEKAWLSGLAQGTGGVMLVTDTFNKTVWQIERDKVTRLAGVTGEADLSGEPVPFYFDAPLDKAYFMEPWDIVPFMGGYAVSDAEAHVVRYIRGDAVYTLSGSGEEGDFNGAATVAAFSRPTGLAVSGSVLYVADAGNGSIRRVSEDGRVTDLVTGLSEPTGLSCSDGALYVAETGRSRILKVSTGTGAVTVVAGTSVQAEDGVYYGGFRDGPAAAAEFDHPQGIAVHPDGMIYVADTGNSALRCIRDGRVYTLLRGGEGSAAPVSPRGLLIQDGILYAADSFAGELLELPLMTADEFFEDVPDWCAAAVREAVRRGLTNGTSDTTFTPNGPLTRAQFVVMLSRLRQSMDGSAVIDGDASFPDVSADDWFASAARWAADQGVVAGMTDGRFSPSTSISRQQIVTMLYRYAKALDLNVSAGQDTNILSYNDAFDVSGYAMEAMQWACGMGILSGNNGNLMPARPATRAQAVTILMNFMNAYGY